MFSFTFGASPAATTVDYEYEVGRAVTDDQAVEAEEGLILYISFDQAAIHPDDFNRLQIENEAVLVRIDDNDFCECDNFYCC